MRNHHPLTPRSRLPFAIAIVAAAASAGCARGEPGSARHESPAASNSVVASPAASSSALASLPPVPLSALTRGWEAGTRYAYRLSLTTSIAFQELKTFDFDLTGTVEISPILVTPETATLQLSVPDAQIVSRLAEARPKLAGVAAEMRGASAFVTLKGGRSSEIRIQAATPVMVMAMFRQLAAALQFVEAREHSTRYTAEEYDTTGLYLTEYEGQADPLRWRKRKLRYLGLLGTADAKSSTQIVPTVQASSGEIHLFATGRPSSIQLQDETVVEGAQVPIRSSVRVSLVAERELAARDASQARQLFASLPAVSASEPIGNDVAVAALDDARIGDLDFDTIVKRLEVRTRAAATTGSSASAGGAPGTSPPAIEQEDSRLFLALSAIFRKDPSTVARALAMVRQGSPASDILLDALGAAASPDAQGVLVRLVTVKSTEPRLRERALAALVRTRKPSPEAIEALKQLARDSQFDRAALYGLGTYSRRMRDEGRVTAAGELGEFLKARLEGAKGAPAQVTALRAIANSGYAGALSSVRLRLGDEREAVRAAAVRALQSMKDSHADDLIAERLATDTTSVVKLAALEAAALREPAPTLARAVSSAGTEAPDPKVRYRAVELLVRWLPKQSELRPVLERIAQSEEVPRVREAAKAAL